MTREQKEQYSKLAGFKPCWKTWAARGDHFGIGVEFMCCLKEGHKGVCVDLSKLSSMDWKTRVNQ